MSSSLRSPAHQALIVRLRQARKDAGLRQAQVAKRLGVAQSYIAKVEGGERRLDVIEFIQLISAIGVEPAVVIADIARLSMTQTHEEPERDMDGDFAE